MIKFETTSQNQQNDLCIQRRLISQGIHPVWSVFTVCLKKVRILNLPMKRIEKTVWFEFAGGTGHFVVFFHAPAHLSETLYKKEFKLVEKRIASRIKTYFWKILGKVMFTCTFILPLIVFLCCLKCDHLGQYKVPYLYCRSSLSVTIHEKVAIDWANWPPNQVSWHAIIVPFEPHHEKNLFMSYWNNKGADQPAYLRSLISAYVVCYMDSIIPILAIAEISSSKPVSSADHAGSSLNWSQTLKTGFLATWLICHYCLVYSHFGRQHGRQNEPHHEKTCLRGFETR